MKSGLEGRNNYQVTETLTGMIHIVSMKSGLEGRNNPAAPHRSGRQDPGLNEVRPRRPEQLYRPFDIYLHLQQVSMKSGLEGRNNSHRP